MAKNVSRRTLLKALTSGCAFALLAPAVCAADETAESVRELIEAPFFSWGGIGIGATISSAEKAFRTLAKQPSASAVNNFETIYRKAATAGRLYALLGLRDLAPARFGEVLPKALKSGEPVETITGCIVDRDSESGIASLIAAGAYGLRPRSAQDIRKALKDSRNHDLSF